MFDFKGKSVVYVGGFSGVGYQVCRLLMKKHISHLVIASRMENVEMLKKLQAENDSVKVMFVHMDLMDRSSILKCINQVVAVTKFIDVLINGAGVLADKDVETTVNVDLTGLINVTLMSLPFMDKSHLGHGGLVVNISSVYGLEPAPAFAVYAAAKHGVVGFTRSLGVDFHFKKTGVSFICICPGLTSTELMMHVRNNVTLDDSHELVDELSKAKQQTPEECAVHIVKAMDTPKNGAIYICNLGELKEVTPMVYWHM